ncbi:MAG: hypothetical protein JJU28_05880 [Cyclobacteriaceae bacterium]|nr:hypothetical protein [Cyclobacteriaceae bacterium]
MRFSFLIALLVFHLNPFAENDGHIAFRFLKLPELSLHKTEIRFSTPDLYGKFYDIHLFKDDTGLFYWYGTVQTPVCLTGECKNIEIGLYWKLTGEFLGIEVLHEHLTKADHTPFLSEDYDMLISILSNEWAIFREYDLEDLIYPDLEYVDGHSGATHKQLIGHTVPNAVYTTYTLWHLIYGDIQNQIKKHSAKQINANGLFPMNVLEQFPECRNFILEQVNLGTIVPTVEVLNLAFIGMLQNEDLYFFQEAIKTLGRFNLNDYSLQDRLSLVYSSASLSAKQKLLQTLKSVDELHTVLYDALGEDVKTENPWFLYNLLIILNKSKTHSAEIKALAHKLVDAKDPNLRKIAVQILDK